MQAWNLVCDRGDEELTVIWPYEKACCISFWKVFDRDFFAGKKVSVTEGWFSPKYPDYSMSGELKKGHFIRAVYGGLRAYASIHYLKLIRVTKMKRKAQKNGNYYSTYISSALIPKEDKGYETIRRWDCEIYKKINDRISSDYTCELYVHAYNGFGYREPDYTKMKFCKEYYEIVDAYFEEGVEYIGIHIRRGDHDICRRVNLTDEFCRMIDKEIERNPLVKFVLATDSREEEEYIISRFGNRIVTQGHKELGRDKESGIQAGIVDLLLLSKCRYIIGSEGSMFSRFAAWMGGIELKYSHDNRL